MFTQNHLENMFGMYVWDVSQLVLVISSNIFDLRYLSSQKK